MRRSIGRGDYDDRDRGGPFQGGGWGDRDLGFRRRHDGPRLRGAVEKKGQLLGRRGCLLREGRLHLVQLLGELGVLLRPLAQELRHRLHLLKDLRAELANEKLSLLSRGLPGGQQGKQEPGARLRFRKLRPERDAAHLP